MKNVILIFLIVSIRLIHGDDDIKCENVDRVNSEESNLVVCFNNNELVYVNGSEFDDNLLIGEPNLKSIAPNAFQDLSITTLHLELTQILEAEDSFRIQKKSFEGLRQLKSLSITQGILHLEHNIFAAMESLESLSIKSCRFTLAKDGSFTGLPKLRELAIVLSYRSVIPPGIFTGLDELKKLNLTLNKIRIIPKNIFNHMKHLDLLNLNSNKINTIEDGAFDGMSVKTLDLRFNELTSIPIRAFDGASIDHLKLQNNPIIVIEFNAFAHSTIGELYYTGKYMTIDKQFMGLGESTILVVD